MRQKEHYLFFFCFPHFNCRYKDSAENVTAKCREIKETLKKAGIRVTLDDRDTMTPPKKFFYHELRGVPVRLEVGPKGEPKRHRERRGKKKDLLLVAHSNHLDLEKGCCVLVRRDTGTKTMGVALDTLTETLHRLFAQIQTEMLEKAKKAMFDRLKVVTEWSDFVPSLNALHLVLASWCDTKECEKAIKLDSSEEAKNLTADGFALTAAAKSLCIPADQGLAKRALPEKCFHCANPAKVWCLFGRSY